MTHRIRVVGLCGGIGAGKSTVATLLAERGATVIDVDALGRQVLTDDDVHAAVVAEFGDGVLDADGAVDRKALAAEVFASKGRLTDLEAISHPAINRELDRRLTQLAGPTESAGNMLVILDMAVLVESDLGRLPNGRGYREVVVVEADLEIRLARLVGRGMTVENASARMAAQADDAERRAVADHVVVNNGDEVELAAEVDRLFEQLTSEPVTSGERSAPDRCTPGY
ncbi:MAG: dephospho-CoA kinase [Acidimicrobiales bacterium]|nr:dephospho-CoA kinase [Acidimicrobiales bacterium]MDP6911086.1 dephospho-CoA kinase [Acidimicrobiales bacterium]HJM72524.1 dephospho-CoA kinase [Acidimicrobiales bacterium]